MATLEIAVLRTSFDGQEVVRGLDLAVGSGEVWALVGPSGCDKTVLLRTVAGLITPDVGAIRMDERDITALPPISARHCHDLPKLCALPASDRGGKPVHQAAAGGQDAKCNPAGG